MKFSHIQLLSNQITKIEITATHKLSENLVDYKHIPNSEIVSCR